MTNLTHCLLCDRHLDDESALWTHVTEFHRVGFFAYVRLIELLAERSS